MPISPLPTLYVLYMYNICGLEYQPPHNREKVPDNIAIPTFPDVGNVDMTNQITVWLIAYVFHVEHIDFIFLLQGSMDQQTIEGHGSL